MDAADLEPSAFRGDPVAVYAFLERFFEGLVFAGVAHVCISPGSRSTPLALAAEEAPGLRTFIGLDERASSFFALGLAKATRRPVAIVCTSGTAAANYFPAVIEAQYSRVPLLVLTADLTPWAFAVPAYKSDALARRLEDLLAEVPEEEPVSDPTEDLLESLGTPEDPEPTPTPVEDGR